MSRTQSLSVAQLKKVFGVSHVTIYNWQKLIDFPVVGERTAGAVSRWARTNKKPLVHHPLDVLLGRSSKKADASLRRTGSGKLTGISPKQTSKRRKSVQ